MILSNPRHLPWVFRFVPGRSGEQSAMPCSPRVMLVASLCLPLLLAACSTKDKVDSPGDELELSKLSTAAVPVETRRIAQPGDSVHGSGSVILDELAGPAPSKPAVVEPTPEELAAAALASLRGEAVAAPATKVPAKAASSKTETASKEAKPEAKAEAKPVAKAEATPDKKAEVKVEPKPVAAVKPQEETAAKPEADRVAAKPSTPVQSEKSAEAASEPTPVVAPEKSASAKPAEPTAEPAKAAEAPVEARKWATAQPLEVKTATAEPVSTAPAASARAAGPDERAQPRAVQLFPGVRVDRASRVVEFDATVAVDAHDAQAPNVYLELIACVPDTREHESLVVTKAKAAQIHAALLLIGLEPGTPGRIDFTGPKPTAISPKGPAMRVAISWQEGGKTVTRSIEELVKNVKDGKNLPTQSWLFAGSRFAKRKDASGQPVEVYDAEGMGTLIGLATFGSETIAPSTVFSPDAALSEPVWIADAKTMPKVGASVVVRLTPVDAPGAGPAAAPQGGKRFGNVER